MYAHTMMKKRARAAHLNDLLLLVPILRLDQYAVPGLFRFVWLGFWFGRWRGHTQIMPEIKYSPNY
jgi:hypothetical protein